MKKETKRVIRIKEIFAELSAILGKEVRYNDSGIKNIYLYAGEENEWPIWYSDYPHVTMTITEDLQIVKKIVPGNPDTVWLLTDECLKLIKKERSAVIKKWAKNAFK